MIREFSAGGLVYKKEGSQVFWLIRKPKANDGYRGNLGWSFPKGWIDEGENAEQAALRETAEEGGVRAKILSQLPTLKIFYTNRESQKVMKFITYFAMEWLENLPEGFGEETEEIRWVSRIEADGLLAYQNEKDLLEKAQASVQL